MRYAAVLIVLSGLVPGFARAAEFDHGALAGQTLTRHIQPGYARLSDAARKLEKELESHCGVSAGGNLSNVKQAFGSAVLAWSRIEHLRFGPIMKEARHARMVYWPDRKGLGRKQVARALRKRDAGVTSLKSLQAKSVALQGFGALEYILYAKDGGTQRQAGPSRSHACAFMRAIAANISQISAEVLNQWSGAGGFVATFLKPGPDNPVYLEPREVTLEITKSALVGLERVRDIRIAGPLGLQRKSARRKAAAFERSGLSTRAIAANLEGIFQLFGEGGLLERIERHETGMGMAIRNDLKASLKQLKSIKLPMKAAAQDPDAEDKLMAVGFPLRTAREETARVLAEAAGLSLGFNALDGD